MGFHLEIESRAKGKWYGARPFKHIARIRHSPASIDGAGVGSATGPGVGIEATTVVGAGVVEKVGSAVGSGFESRVDAGVGSSVV